MAEQLTKQPASSESSIDWRGIGQAMLKQSIPINPLSTHPDEIAPEWEDIQVSLGSVDRQRGENIPEIHREYTQEQFFEKVLEQGKSPSKGRRIAIIGASGSGKTTILHKIAQAILDKTEEIPIWISLNEIGNLSITQYLQEKWLPRIPKKSLPNSVDVGASFQTLLNSGRVWLLLDGVDEMSLEQFAHSPPGTSPTILHPLGEIPYQLQSLGEKSRVILTSRNYVWEIDKTLLHNFDIYYPLGFSEAEEIQQFIKKWFAHTSVQAYHSFALWEANQEKNPPQDLAASLQDALQSFGQHRIQVLLKNPLHLALICRLWQQKSPSFPSTQFSLYQQLVKEYYQWQAEKITLNSEDQQQLNQALGVLALKALKTQPHSLWLSHEQVIETLGEDTPLLRACLRLGWLKSIGVNPKNHGERIYAFLDGIFLDYFAAFGLEDWRFFLPENSPESEPPQPHPIFENQWKRVILLWLGREDIAKQEKEDFISALVGFKDDCGSDNYYGKRAFYLALSGLAEFFSDSSQVDPIITRLVRELLDPSALTPPIAETAKIVLTQTYRPKVIQILIKYLLSSPTEKVQREIFRLLEKMGKGNPHAIEALVKLLELEEIDALQWRGADCLGKISPGHPTAVAILINSLEKATKEEEYIAAFNSLDKIGKGNSRAIAALARQLAKTPSGSLQRRIFASLENIAYGNATGIAHLVQLIRTTSDLNLRRQAAETLEKIDPGNPTAIAVLVQLLQNAPQEEMRQQVIYSLGEIAPGNGEAIEALVGLINSPQIVFTHWIAISSLGKIAPGSALAIKTLVDLIQSTEQALLRKDAIESLSKIDPDNPVAIKALVELMESTNDEAIRQEAAASLGKIDPGNPEAIAALTQLLHHAEDEFTRRQAAASLGKIDSGNLEALTALVKLIETTPDHDIRSLAAESIGEIGQNNPTAIATLIRLLQSDSEEKTLKQAAKSLGKIGSGHPDAIAILTELIDSNCESATRLQAAESLISLLPLSQMKTVITRLKNLFADPLLGKALPAQKILWHCVQQMPYPDFYGAWHEEEALPIPPLPPIFTLNPTPVADLTVIQRLRAAISVHRQLRDQITLLYIDSREFVDPDSPLIDIYDQLLAQNCPPFAHGLPDTLPKLKLYWHSFCRAQSQKPPVLIFWEDSITISRNLLKAFAKFNSPILAIVNPPVEHLPCFSPEDPELIARLIQWLLDNLSKKA